MQNKNSETHILLCLSSLFVFIGNGIPLQRYVIICLSVTCWCAFWLFWINCFEHSYTHGFLGECCYSSWVNNRNGVSGPKTGHRFSLAETWASREDFHCCPFILWLCLIDSSTFLFFLPFVLPVFFLCMLYVCECECMCVQVEARSRCQMPSCIFLHLIFLRHDSSL